MVNEGSGRPPHVSRVAYGPEPPYLTGYGVSKGSAMSATVTNGGLSRPLLLMSLVGGLMVAATVGLWAYYGTAIFFEMVRDGWIACF